MRKYVLAGVVVAVVAMAPAAQARPSIVVEAVAVGHFGGAFEQFDVEWECAAANAGTAGVVLADCIFGGVDAVQPCFECYNPPFAAASESFRLGEPYQLCVRAYVYSPYQVVQKCAPYSYLTNSVVIAG